MGQNRSIKTDLEAVSAGVDNVSKENAEVFKKMKEAIENEMDKQLREIYAKTSLSREDQIALREEALKDFTNKFGPAQVVPTTTSSSGPEGRAQMDKAVKAIATQFIEPYKQAAKNKQAQVQQSRPGNVRQASNEPEPQKSTPGLGRKS